MFSFRKLPLGRRLAAAMGTACGTVIVVVALGTLGFEWRAVRVRALVDLAVQTVTIDAQVRAAVERRDATAAASALALLPDIDAAAIYSADGTVLARRGRASAGAGDVPAKVGTGGHFHGTFVEAWHAVPLAAGAPANVFVRRDLAVAYAGLAPLFFVVLAAAGVAAIIVAWLTHVLRHAVGDPVRLLTKAAEAVKEKQDFTVRVPHIADHELGALIDAFNDMLAGLATRADAAKPAETRKAAPRATRSSAATDVSDAPWPTRVLEGAPEFLAIVDAEGAIDFLNRAARERLGVLKMREFTSSSLKDFVAEAQRTELLDDVLPVAERTGEWRGELTWRTSAGREKKLATTIVAHRSAVGTAEFFSITARDPGDAERAGEDVVRSEARLRLALRAAQMGTWEWDAVANEVTWDETSLGLFGKTAESFAGTHEAFLACVHPDDRAIVEAALLRAFGEGGSYSAEFCVTLPDGKRRWIAALGGVMRDADGRPARMTGIFYEIAMRASSPGRSQPPDDSGAS